MNIITFTLHFDLAEDRIRIEALDEGRGQQTFFLTHKLASRLIGTLLTRLDSEAAAIAGGGTDRADAPIAAVRQSVREVVQSIAQQQVRISRSEGGAETTPVVAKPETQRWLCRTIHFTNTATGIVLEMTDDADHRVRLVMSTTDIRAVLDGFVIVYQKAEWDQKVFPEWLTENTPAAAGAEFGPRVLN